MKTPQPDTPLSVHPPSLDISGHGDFYALPPTHDTLSDPRYITTTASDIRQRISCRQGNTWTPKQQRQATKINALLDNKYMKNVLDNMVRHNRPRTVRQRIVSGFGRFFGFLNPRRTQQHTPLLPHQPSVVKSTQSQKNFVRQTLKITISELGSSLSPIIHSLVLKCNSFAGGKEHTDHDVYISTRLVQMFRALDKEIISEFLKSFKTHETTQQHQTQQQRSSFRKELRAFLLDSITTDAIARFLNECSTDKKNTPQHMLSNKIYMTAVYLFMRLLDTYDEMKKGQTYNLFQPGQHQRQLLFHFTPNPSR